MGPAWYRMSILDRNKALVPSWLLHFLICPVICIQSMFIKLKWNQMTATAVSTLFSIKQQVKTSYMLMTLYRYWINNSYQQTDNTTLLTAHWILWTNGPQKYLIHTTVQSCYSYMFQQNHHPQTVYTSNSKLANM